jgi:hypothetical protein
METNFLQDLLLSNPRWGWLVPIVSALVIVPLIAWAISSPQREEERRNRGKDSQPRSKAVPSTADKVKALLRLTR